MIKKIRKIILKNKLLVLILFIAATASALLFLYCPNDPNARLSDPTNYNQLAENLVRFHIYGGNNTEAIENSASAYRPPGYPMFIALIYLLNFSEWKIVIIAQVLLFLVSIIMIFGIAKKYFGQKIAYVAVIAYSTNITILLINNSLWTESLTLSLLVISLFFYYYFDDKDKRFRNLNLAISGLSFSWLILTRPTFLIYLFILIFLVIFFWLKTRKIHRVLLIFIIWALIPIVVWSIRSSIVAKTPVLVSTNAGVNYMLGNNPYNINGRAAYYPNQDYLLKNEIGGDVAQTENQLNDNNAKAAIKWIFKEPALFFRMAFSKIQYLFALDDDIFGNEVGLNRLPAQALRILRMVFFSILLFFSLIGLYFVNNKKLLIWLVPYFIMVIVTFADTRFVVPLLIPMSLLAALAIVNLRNILKNWAYLVLVLLVFFSQFNLFYPVLQKDFLLAREYYRGSNDSNIIAKTENKYFITDSFVKNESEKIIYKKVSENGDDKKLIFYRENQIMTENELIDLIDQKQLYTDLTSVFTNIDPLLYPRLVNQNILVYYKNIYKPIFMIIYEGLAPTKITTIHDKSLISTQPGQIEDLLQFDGRKNDKYLFSCALEPNSQIIITMNNQRIILDNYSSTDRSLFNIIIKMPEESLVILGLKNNVSFGNPHSYNVFTGQRRTFQNNGAEITQVLKIE